jgi:hypothetical protein
MRFLSNFRVVILCSNSTRTSAAVAMRPISRAGGDRPVPRPLAPTTRGKRRDGAPMTAGRPGEQGACQAAAGVAASRE